MLTIVSSMIHNVFLFDVGHGDCVLLKENGGESFLIDCGAQYPTRYKHIPRIIESECRKLGACGLAISHYHWDHYSLFDLFTQPEKFFLNIYVPDLPATGPQREIGTAIQEFLWLACFARYQYFYILPEILKRTRKFPIACHSGQTIQEAGLHFNVVWPDLSSPVLLKRRIRKRARIVKSVVQRVSEKYGIPLPPEIQRFSMEQFLRNLTDLPPSKLSEPEIQDVHKNLRRIEDIFHDDLANVFSLALKSSDRNNTRLLFLGDLPEEVLNIIDAGSGRFHLIKAAHHGTEFGKNLEKVSTGFVLVSRNKNEFPNLHEIHQGYLDNLGAPMLITELLGSCHLKRLVPFPFKKQGKQWSAGAVTFTRKGGLIRYLLLRRKASATWDFPIGKNKAEDKSPKDTSKREVKEEAGIDVTVLKGFDHLSCYSTLVPVADWVYAFTYDGSVFLFLAEATDTTVQVDENSEHNLFAWLPLEKAIERLSFPNSKIALLKAHSFLVSKTAFSFH